MLTNWARLQVGWETVRLFRTQEGILPALANGWLLKSHRYLDGSKVYVEKARMLPIACYRPQLLCSLENALEIVEHTRFIARPSHPKGVMVGALDQR